MTNFLGIYDPKSTNPSINYYVNEPPTSQIRGYSSVFSEQGMPDFFDVYIAKLNKLVAKTTQNQKPLTPEQQEPFEDILSLV